jgi:hypothetical protein
MDSVIDEEVWDRLAGIIWAAHQMDKRVFLARARSLAEEVDLPRQQRAGLYVWYLLRNALGGKVGGRVPTDAELARIARDCFALFSPLVNADRTALEETFRKVFERAPLEKESSAGSPLRSLPGQVSEGQVYARRR